MSIENPLWGAPRIHGELLKLEFEVAQSSVAKYMVKRHGAPSQGWRTFLRNHAPDIAAMDLFVAPTIGFGLLYALVIVRLDRRDLVWVNVTANPTLEWIGSSPLRPGLGFRYTQVSTQALDPHSAETIRLISRRALEELDALKVDSKLEVLGALLRQLTVSDRAARRTCIAVDYLATLYYLATDLEEHGLTYETLDRHMLYDAQQQPLKSFADAGGILLATTGALRQELDLSYVTDLVLYDFLTRDQARQIVPLLNNRRTSKLHVHLLTAQV